jgi:hypothetical protein
MMIRILLPLLLIPDKLQSMHIQFFTDKMACVFEMQDGYVKNDKYESLIIRAVHLIGAYLGSVLHFTHFPRRSSWETKTADNLTRYHSTSFLEKQILGRYNHLRVPEQLTNWLNSLTDDWNLALSLLNHVMAKTK